MHLRAGLYCTWCARESPSLRTSAKLLHAHPFTLHYKCLTSTEPTRLISTIKWCGNQSSAATCALSLLPHTGPSSKEGGGHVLALAADGRLWGWGCNHRGQLGLGSSAQWVSAPAEVLDVSAASALGEVGWFGTALVSAGHFAFKRKWQDGRHDDFRLKRKARQIIHGQMRVHMHIILFSNYFHLYLASPMSLPAVLEGQHFIRICRAWCTCHAATRTAACCCAPALWPWLGATAGGSAGWERVWKLLRYSASPRCRPACVPAA